MAEENQKPRPFDVRTVRYLIRLMSQHDLSEIDLTEGDRRIRLRRGTRVKAVAPGIPPPSPVPAPPVSPPMGGPAADKPAKKLLEIRSPAVGTFYVAAKPGLPPFVTLGSRVAPSTVVCIVEAMKVMNEITADCNGVISEICVKDGEGVEYNTVLFRVDPTG